MVAPILPFRDGLAGAYGIPLGKTWMAIGDSITSEVSSGQYATQLAATYTGTFLGRTDPVINGLFETNATGWNAELNCTIARDNTCPGISDITGAWALKITATATGVTFPNIGAGLNVMQLNSVAGQYQTVGLAVWIQAGFTGNVYLQCYDRPTGGGAYVTTNSGAISAASGAGAWQYLFLTRLVPVGTTEWFVRVILDAPTAGQSIWVDGGSVVHTNGLVLPAIGGAALAAASVSGNANSILDGWASRVTAFGVPGVAILAAGTNDFFAQSATYTPSLWGNAVQVAIGNLKAMSPQPVLIVLGIPPAKTAVPTGGLVATGFASGQALRDAMDAQTRASCAAAGIPFVPLFDMPLAYTDGIHPDASLLGVGTSGHTWMAQRVKDVMNRVRR